METVAENKVEYMPKQHLESWQIESQLAEIGVQYIPISWTDGFLMAENLQNYFAEVIAGYSLLELEEEKKENIDFEKLKNWEVISLKAIRARQKHYDVHSAEAQKILLWLMREAKNIEKLRNNGI
jgi:hypothetical protein